MIDRIESLQGLMKSQRLRWQRWHLLEAVGWTLSGLLGYFLIAVLIDNVAHLPILGRFALTIGLILMIGWLGRHLVARLLQRPVTEDEIALAIERRTHGVVENRLINALQIGRESAQGQYALAPALIQENCRHLATVTLPAATTIQPATRWLIFAAFLSAIAAGGWLWQPQRFASSAARILMPFASIDPIYRTRLEVEPGDIEAAGDIQLRIRILGEIPEELAVLTDEQNRLSTHVVSTNHSRTVSYRLRNVKQSLSYAVRGGDFMSPYYRIEVPTPARLKHVEATYTYPEYTRISPKSVTSQGDLEALARSHARLKFTLDQPVEHLRLLMRSRPDSDRSTDGQHAKPRTLELQQSSATEYVGELSFDDVSEYALEAVRPDRPSRVGPWYAIRIVDDEPPRLTLTGLPSNGELGIDSPISVQVEAVDDLGLAQMGLFFRRTRPSVESEATDGEGWTAIQTTTIDHLRQATNRWELLPANCGLVEGERIELAARALDFNPDRATHWTTGTPQVLLIASDGSQLQLLYEQILKTEAELAALIEVEQRQFNSLERLVRTLDNDPNADGNDPERVKVLVATATETSLEQDQTRQTAGRIAREMAAPAGNLRLSVALLADAEMVRAIRILDSVVTRDDAAGRRTSFADVRATTQRIVQSLNEIYEQYVRFRKEWELAHMTSFLRMLADRQALLRDQTVGWRDGSSEVSETLRESASRRQTKLAELCGLAATAFSGLAERAAELELPLSETFAETSETLDGEELQSGLSAATDALTSSEWSTAADRQTEAAILLDALYTRLREAQNEAARQMLSDMDQHEESDLAGQADIEKLKQGNTEDMLDEPEGLSLENIIHNAEVARAKKDGTGNDEEYKNDYLFPDSAVPGLQRADSGMRQEFKNLKLAESPGKTPSFPSQSDRQSNRVKPHIQEKFEDLVGDLLEEEDEMKENYETFNLNAAFNINEKGDVGKQGGDLNSTAAAAATGNQKPPTTNVGGASRVGRQGARAHGAAVGNESINRRGRDKVQEGQERVPDQAGSVKETKSDDPQSDTSTGIGGRKVESDEATFSLSDSGEWSDDMIDRMDKPLDKQSIVERQGAKFDSELAEKLRDMTSKQEQTIERLKSIRKDLKNLYLPTEHLDQLIDQMQANLQSLNDRPTADIFRLQQETLEKVRGVLQVFHQAHSGFQASLPRDQHVRGRIVDEPARSAPPGYEAAVKVYYERLAAPEGSR
ncbi:MAG: hypothetical protein O2955_02030 [Planctomycetota bacterium]|nr:hypothetical protein [Planctomycetota bacterium]MDA1211261.1 hypothetical protein [Planctomycetota bacterium]